MKIVNLRRILRMAATVYWEYKPRWTPRRLTTSLEDIEIDRPIFILGVQGGGLTLLTRMLHRNERVVTIGGGRAYWTGNNEMDKQYIGQLPEDFTLRSPRYQSPTFKRHMTGEEEVHPIFGVERDWVYASAPLLGQFRKTAEDWTPPKANRLKRAIKESIRAYASDTGQARFLDMSQTFSLKVPLLRRIFPDARFIIQARNPYAVCARAARDFRYGWVRKFEANRQVRLLKLKLLAEHWYNTFALATEDLNNYEHKIFVRYEDLVKQPAFELQRITRAVGLDYSPDMVPRAHHRLPLGSGEQHKWFPIRTDTNEKYLVKLNAISAKIIAEEVEPLARRLGYGYPL